MLQTSPFENVISYSFWDIPPNYIKTAKCTVETFSYFSSKRQACLLQHIKMVKPPDKRPGISDMGHLFCIFVELISIHLAETVLQHSSRWPGCFKSMLAYMIIIFKIPKIHHVFAQDVPCKFVIALSFENKTREESRNNWHFKWPNGFMSPFSTSIYKILPDSTPMGNNFLPQ